MSGGRSLFATLEMGEVQQVIYRVGNESRGLDLKTGGTGEDLQLVYSLLWQEWPAGSW